MENKQICLGGKIKVGHDNQYMQPYLTYCRYISFNILVHKPIIKLNRLHWAQVYQFF